MKPGWQTTEFWGRAIVSVVGLLVGSGAVQPEVAEHIQGAVDSAVPIIQSIIDGLVQLTGLITAFALQWRQGKERLILKSIELKK